MDQSKSACPFFCCQQAGQSAHTGQPQSLNLVQAPLTLLLSADSQTRSVLTRILHPASAQKHSGVLSWFARREATPHGCTKQVDLSCTYCRTAIRCLGSYAQASCHLRKAFRHLAPIPHRGRVQSADMSQWYRRMSRQAPKQRCNTCSLSCCTATHRNSPPNSRGAACCIPVGDVNFL
jgi:hypothetical protein